MTAPTPNTIPMGDVLDLEVATFEAELDRKMAEHSEAVNALLAATTMAEADAAFQRLDLFVDWFAEQVRRLSGMAN